MNISLRVKFFVVLLAFSLGPILLSRSLTGREADRLSADLSNETRAELLEIVSAELQHNAKTLMSTLDGYGQAMTLGAYSLGEQTLKALDSAQDSSGAKPYYAIDYADPDTLPADAAPSQDFIKRTMSGKSRPLVVSFKHPSIHLPQGVNPADVKGQINRLQSLTPSFRAINDELDGAVLTMQVALESGVLLAFPGRGGFPSMYDPREQNWYRRAKASTDGAWTTPTVDPTTRQAVSTMGYPIRDKNGTFLGVSAVEVPHTTMLGLTDLKSRWSDETQSFMVARFPGDTTTNDGLLILAQQSYGEGGGSHWMAGIEHEWMESDDPEAFKELLLAMKESESGFMRLPYKGKDSVWAYASNPDYSIILIAPETVIAQLPDKVTGALDGLFDEMRDISAIISGVMLIVTGLIAWFGSRTVTRPMIAMAHAARELAKGDFSVRMTGRTGDERDVLIDSFNDMVPQLQERMHLRRDLEIAEEVQKLLLPRSKPSLPGYDLSGGITFCDQTGGDYFDFIEVESDEGKALGVVLGDVSGHGVASALLMATARGQLNALSQLPLRPEQRINAINTFLSRDMDGTGRFLTLFYLRLKENDPTVCWVRAGHDPAIRYTSETDAFSELNGDGLALGVLEDFDFQSYETTLTPNEVLVMATDGVWEARGVSGEMFGKQRMLAIVKESAHKSAEDIRVAIMTAVDEYQANGQEDDIAVVVIKKV